MKFLILVALFFLIPSASFIHCDQINGAVPAASPAMLSPNHANVLVSSNMSGPNAEVEQLYNPVNHVLYEVWIANYSIGFAYSTDRGASFQGQMVVPGSQYFFNSTYIYSWDPSIALFPNGTIAVAFMHEFLNGSISPVVDLSFNGGNTFPVHSVVNPVNNASFSDRDFIAVAPNGTMYVTWNYAPSRSMVKTLCPPGGSCYYATGDFNGVISHSSDLGKTWSKPSVFSPYYPYGGMVAAPIVIAPNGTIMILYEDYNMSSSHAVEKGYNYFIESSDGGVTWSKRVMIGPSPGAYLPNTDWWIDGAIMLGSNGEIYTSYDVTIKGVDVPYLSYSLNGGSSWSNVKVAGSTTNYDHLIQPVGGPNGTVLLGWVTNSSLPGLTAFVRIYSTETGSFLTPAEKMSDFYGFNYAWGGDTLGISMIPGNTAAMSWGALEPGTQNAEIYYSSLAFYNVTVKETGLPNGTSWHVLLPGFSSANVSATVMKIELPNGNYTLSGISSPAGNYIATQTFTVAGNSTIVDLVFKLAPFSITFQEKGLPSGKTWSIRLDTVDTTRYSNSSLIVFNVTNGVYKFSIEQVSGYYSTTQNGSLTVMNKSLVEIVDYSEYAHLSIRMSPSNSSLYLNGKLIPHSTAYANESLKAGSYSIEVVHSGYVNYYNNISLSAGQYANVTANLNKPSSGGGLLSGYGLYYLVAGVVGAIIAGSAVFYYSKKRK